MRTLRRVALVGMVALGLLAPPPFAQAQPEARNSEAVSVPGDRLWSRRLSAAQAKHIAVSPDGSTVYVTGDVAAGALGETDIATQAFAAATGTRLWIKRYSGAGGPMDFAGEVAVSPDGSSVYVTAAANGLGTDLDAVTIAYTAATGAQRWLKVYNGPQDALDSVQNLAVSPDGSTVYVAGETWSAVGDPESSDYLILAYDTATGSPLWAKRYNGPADGYDIIGRGVGLLELSPDGSALFATGTSTGTTGGLDFATLALDATTGARLWLRRYNGTGNSHDNAHGLAVSPDGSMVFVVGDSLGTGAMDYATIAYDAVTGARLWARRYNGPGNGDDWGVEVGVAPDGARVFVTGWSPGSGTNQDIATLAYEASTGASKWTKRYNGAAGGADGGFELAVAPDGSTVYVTGYTRGTVDDELVILAYAAVTGASKWTKRYNGAGGPDVGVDIAVAPDGSTVYVTGNSGPDLVTLAYAA